MSTKPKRTTIPAALGVALVLAGSAVAGPTAGSGAAARSCDDPLPRGAEPSNLDPADFTTRITNPYWPMAPGNRWVYRATDANGNVQRIVVTVTKRTRRVANGVRARVVRDVVTEKGRPIEATDDWYAQDACGNIWYLGEATTQYENGKPTATKGSFEAGVDGAQAGIAIPADPRPGMEYRQEFYAGEAEDAARVLSVREQAEVPFGHFTDVLLTRDYTPLEPRALEFKLYARGVGPVLALDISGGSVREELVRFHKGRG